MAAPGRQINGTVEFELGDEQYTAAVSVPDGRVRPRELLPALHSIEQVVIDTAVRNVERDGQSISCRKGCGACCRQVVPISEAEAHQVHDLVQRMPEPRRAEIRRRFANALERFRAAGLLDRLRRPGDMSSEQRQALALDYFRQWVACPFLEEEACSIWPDRPLACREYLVTTPAENCSTPLEEPVVSVGLPGRVSVALGQMAASAAERGVWWIPLVLAPEWAAAHPNEPRARPAKHVLREIVDRLVGR